MLTTVPDAVASSRPHTPTPNAELQQFTRAVLIVITGSRAALDRTKEVRAEIGMPRVTHRLHEFAVCDLAHEVVLTALPTQSNFENCGITFLDLAL